MIFHPFVTKNLNDQNKPRVMHKKNISSTVIWHHFSKHRTVCVALMPPFILLNQFAASHFHQTLLPFHNFRLCDCFSENCISMNLFFLLIKNLPECECIKHNQGLRGHSLWLKVKLYKYMSKEKCLLSWDTH